MEPIPNPNLNPIEATTLFKIDFGTIDFDGEQFFSTKVSSCKTLPTPKAKTILLVVDKSGSMDGENIKHTKEVMKKFLSFFKTQLSDASITIIMFDTEQKIIKDANKEDLKTMEKTIDGISAGGGTYFSGIFETMADFIKNRKHIEDFTIIFMTDGKIEYEPDMKNKHALLNEKLEMLNKMIKTRVGVVDIHALGLGKGHDPFLLEKLVNLKKENSSFLFIINETGIDPSFNAVKDMIISNNIQGELVLVDTSGNTKKFPLQLTELESTSVVEELREWDSLIRNTVPIDMESINLEESSITIKISNGNINEKFILKEYYLKNVDKSENIYKIQLLKIKEELSNVLAALKKQVELNKYDIAQLDKLAEDKTKQRNNYQSVAIKLYKIREPDLKRSLFKQCEDISPMFNVIDDLLTAGYKKQVKSEVLGKAIQLSHKNIKKKKYIDELESRLPTTVRLFNKQDIKLKELSEKINIVELMKKYPKDIFENYKCFLTCNDFSECLLEGDCLCISFNISRTEQAIVVPSSIKINAIYPTIVSAQSFLNSIKYSINLNFSDDINNPQNEQVVKGIAQESINAALPIYLCDEHWEFSNLLMDRILGWIVTLDPMGYHIAQKMTFPYLLLEYIIEESYLHPKSEFNQTYCKLILDTCIHLLIAEDMKDASHFKENLLKLYSSYIKYGTVRTPDSISKNSFFFIKLYCAILLNWVKVSDQVLDIYFYLIEEELRRIQRKLYQTFQEYAALDVNAIQDETAKKEIIMQYNDEYIKLYLNDCTLLRVIRYLILNKNEYSNDVFDFNNVQLDNSREAIYKELGLDEFTLFTMYFQNQIHHDAAVRRKFFNDNLYYDVRKQPIDVFITYEKNRDEMHVKRQKQIIINSHVDDANINIKDLKKRFRNLEVIGILKEFRLADNMDDATQLLEMAMKIKPGKGVYYYFNIFYGIDEIPLLKEKLLLLKEKHKGYRNGIKLKHNHEVCYYAGFNAEDLVEIFGVKKIPKAKKREYLKSHSVD